MGDTELGGERERSIERRRRRRARRKEYENQEEFEHKRRDHREYQERDDEALLRLEEMEREGGDGRFDGAMDVDEIGGAGVDAQGREQDRDRRSRRGAGGVGEKVHDTAAGEGEVKFKGRGSMKFREFGGATGGRR